MNTGKSIGAMAQFIDNIQITELRRICGRQIARGKGILHEKVMPLKVSAWLYLTHPALNC